MTPVLEKTRPALKTAVSPITKTILDVMQVIDGFSKLLQHETEALRKSDFKAVESLQAEKREFAKLYGEMVTNLSSRREEIGALDAKTREALVNARTKFTIVLSENMRALELMKRSTHRLANRILDAARHAVKDECQTNYSAKGHMQAYKASTLSMRIDETL